MTTPPHPATPILRLPPAQVGMRLEDVSTPSLLVDLNTYEANLISMATLVRRHGLSLRPHAKTHKCVAIARDQIRYGASGVCCQTVGEAEQLVNNGIVDVLVTNEVVAPDKIDRLIALTHRAHMTLCIDDHSNAAAVNTAARLGGVAVDVLAEINVGGDRCGISPGASALGLIQAIQRCSHLRFRGLQAYQGRAQHIDTTEERAHVARSAAEEIRKTIRLLARHGIACPVVTGGGTGTVAFDVTSGVYTEVQPGSYIFLDADYLRVLGSTPEAPRPFRAALFVYTQVISVALDGYAVVDAGLKAMSMDSGMPRVAACPSISYSRPSDEHGMLDIRPQPKACPLAAKLQLIPGHCDPTVNLHDWLVAVRDGRVAALWPIDARGASH